MNIKTRTIEIDAATARTLETRAAASGVTVAEFVADLVADLVANDDLSNDLEAMRRKGRGPWAPSVLAEDVRRYEEYERTGMAIPLEDVEAWVNSWGTSRELPMPKPRKT
jgi:hypothetical protein